MELSVITNIITDTTILNLNTEKCIITSMLFIVCTLSPYCEKRKMLDNPKICWSNGFPPKTVDSVFLRLPESQILKCLNSTERDGYK